jgi:hypothetical protein
MRLGLVGGASALTGCSVRDDRVGDERPERGAGDQPSDVRDPERPKPSQPQRPPYAEQYGAVVDLREVGADRRARRSIVPLLHEHAGDDTLLYLPPGRYLVDETVQIFEFDHLGIVGPKATIVPPDGSHQVLFDIGRPGRASGFRMEGIEFDITAPDTGPRPLSVLSGGNVLLRDISVVGRQDAGWGMVRVDVTDPNGLGRVERLHVPDGSTADTRSAGCLVGDHHRGTVEFVDCHIAGFSDNGLYADPQRGRVHVKSGYFANCAVASLRVGDNSVVRGAHVRCDSAPDGFENMRGIRLRHGSNVLVEDCLVEMFDVSTSDGGITLAHELESATVRNTVVKIDTDDIPAVQVKDPPQGEQFDTPIRFEGLTVLGTAGIAAAVQVYQRRNCRFDGIHLQQTGDDRDGFLFQGVTDATLRDAYIDVSGRPVVSNRSAVEKVNVVTSSGGFVE